MKTSVHGIIHDALVGRRVLATGMSRPGTVTNVEVSLDGAMRLVYLTFAETATELKAEGAGGRRGDVLLITGDEEFVIVDDGWPLQAVKCPWCKPGGCTWCRGRGWVFRCRDCGSPQLHDGVWWVCTSSAPHRV
jgi:hypothetical protein